MLEPTYNTLILQSVIDHRRRNFEVVLLNSSIVRESRGTSRQNGHLRIEVGSERVSALRTIHSISKHDNEMDYAATYKTSEGFLTDEDSGSCFWS